MKNSCILLVFHSKKMLMTLDLNTLVLVLLQEFGNEFTLRLRPMTSAEHDETEETVDMIRAVHSRFFLKEIRSDGEEVRLENLERRVVQEGRK